MSEEIKSKLITIFQDISDIVSAHPDNLGAIIDEMLEQVIALRKYYAEEEIADIAASIAGNDSLELYWLARAGFQSVSSFLNDRLDGEDDCQVMWAAIGLVYLGEEIGLKKLDQLAQASSEDEAELTLEEIYEELETSKLDTLINFKEKIDKGVYGKKYGTHMGTPDLS
jgi:hypothetical protein